MRHSQVLTAVVLVTACLVIWPALAAGGSAPTASAPAAAGAQVDINTAGVAELMRLDGIGRKLAEKIVEYRTSHGPFRKPDELRKVEGVGAALFEKNRARIVVK